MNIYCYTYENGRAVLSGVVDDFISCAFTRSYSGIGEWQIVISNYSIGAPILRNAHFIKITDGVCGIVNTSSIVIDQEDATTTITGIELKGLASMRIVVPESGKSYQSYTNKAPEYIIAELITKQILEPEDTKRQVCGALADYYIGTDRISYNGRFGNVGEEISTIATANSIGWYANIEGNAIKWYIYHGLDRSAEQAQNSRFILSYELNNINTSTLEQTKYIANTALVAGQGEGVDRDIVLLNNSNSGLARVETYIDARDIKENDDLAQRGQEKLAAYGTNVSYVCEASNQIIAQYRTAFDLGDIGTMIDDELGVSFDFRLSELTEVYEGNTIQLHITFGYDTKTLSEGLKRIAGKTDSLIRSEATTDTSEFIKRAELAAYVLKNGDTMTGNLNVSTIQSPTIKLIPTYNNTTNQTVIEGSELGASRFAAMEDANGNNKRVLEVNTAAKEQNIENALKLHSYVNGVDSAYQVYHSGMLIPVANGGTGVNAVADIRAGKDGNGNTISSYYVSLSGAQDITGAKNFNGLIQIKNSSAQPVLDFGTSAANTGKITYIGNTNAAASVLNTGRFNFRQYSFNSLSPAASPLATYEDYQLPTVSEDRATNATYDILTTKTAVSIAQGGTGADNAVSALNNLGVIYSATEPTMIAGRIWLKPVEEEEGA